MNENPYQSPAVEVAARHDARTRPTLVSSAAFGAYAGAIAWSTAGAVSSMIVAIVVSYFTLRSFIEAAVGGAFIGCFVGGVLGALHGALCALMARLDRPYAALRIYHLLLAIAGGCVVMLVPAHLLLDRMWGPVFFIPAFFDGAEWTIAPLIALICLAAGAAGGLWFAPRLQRFVSPSDQREGDIDARR